MSFVPTRSQQLGLLVLLTILVAWALIRLGTSG
jgi:hypothetical protein